MKNETETVVVRNAFEANDLLICFGDAHVPYADSIVNKIINYAANYNAEYEYINDLQILDIRCNTLEQMNAIGNALDKWFNTAIVSDIIPDIQ